jgi:hypothetical protein
MEGQSPNLCLISAGRGDRWGAPGGRCRNRRGCVFVPSACLRCRVMIRTCIGNAYISSPSCRRSIPLARGALFPSFAVTSIPLCPCLARLMACDRHPQQDREPLARRPAPKLRVDSWPVLRFAFGGSRSHRHNPVRNKTQWGNPNGVIGRETISPAGHACGVGGGIK